MSNNIHEKLDRYAELKSAIKKATDELAELSGPIINWLQKQENEQFDHDLGKFYTAHRKEYEFSAEVAQKEEDLKKLQAKIKKMKDEEIDVGEAKEIGEKVSVCFKEK